MMQKFGAFTPDLAHVISGTSCQAKEVIPAPEGYWPFNSFIGRGIAPLPSQCLGAVSIKDLSGIGRIYLGTAIKLYEVAGIGLVDRTRLSGGNYTLASTDRWWFVQYKNQLIAGAFVEPVQVITLGAANFAALITSARKPQGRYATIANLDFLVLGNVKETTDGDTPSRVWWSARGVLSDFTPNISTGSNYRDLDYSYGEIVGLYSREFTTVFQERAVSRMTFEGGSTIFRFDLVEVNLGPISGGAIAHYGGKSYYLSLSGFFMFDGNSSIAIGEGKVNRYVLDRLDYSNRAAISTSVFPSKNIVVWGIPFGESPGINRLFIYNWVINEWSEAVADLDLLFSSYSPAVGIDDIDYYDLSVDEPPQSEWIIDASSFVGGVPVLSAVDSTHTYVVSSGVPHPAILETNYLTNNDRSVISRVIPVIEDLQSADLYVIVRDDLTRTEVEYGPFSLNLFKEFVPTIQSRHFRLRVVAYGFSKAIGLDGSFNPAGVL